jgi:hypothetical protein
VGDHPDAVASSEIDQIKVDAALIRLCAVKRYWAEDEGEAQMPAQDRTLRHAN